MAQVSGCENSASLVDASAALAPAAAAQDTGSKTPMTDDSTYGWYVTAAYTADRHLGVVYNPDTTRNHITLSSSFLGTNPQIVAVDPTTGARANLGGSIPPNMGANAGGRHDWLFVISASPSS
jgi:hypothetical protein